MVRRVRNQVSYEEMLRQARKTGKVYDGVSLAENITKERGEIEKLYTRNNYRKQQSKLFL